MMYLMLVVLCVSGSYVAAQALPPFCKGAECPSYIVTSTGKNYEVRQYAPSKWASTSYIGEWNTNIQRMMFLRLHRYINGENSHGVVMDMTVPVLTRIESVGQGAAKYTMSFMIPSIYSANPPTPTDNLVSILNNAAGTEYFVRNFGGNANGQDIMQQLQQLVNDINNINHYDQTYFYSATYDSPAVRQNRHNEVWLKKIA